MARRRPLSARVQATLRAKAKRRKGITYGTLAKVYRRGQGAFLSAGSRRVSMQAWSFGRVNSFLRGSRKHDLDLRKKTGCTVIGFKAPDNSYIINPEASIKLQNNSHLIVLGRPEQISKLRLLF